MKMNYLYVVTVGAGFLTDESGQWGNGGFLPVLSNLIADAKFFRMSETAKAMLPRLRELFPDYRVTVREVSLVLEDEIF